jgi:hypothetical protein
MHSKPHTKANLAKFTLWAGIKKAEPKTPLMFSERRRITGFDFPIKPKKRNR